MDGRHQTDGHGAVLRDAAEVDPRAGVHDDLRRVEAGGLEVVDETLAHEIALAGRHDG